uniref:Ribosomal protein L16 n=1 Tax=Nitzschia sp. IriIs04 TaxID=1444690 RepID=A0A0S3QPP8_9STRA|nr:ribosomal protein L16 [Nitzschia sp. IriIs04]BAT70304.1 ribosomal protein L16 [Nitzschia sp. IriIs04]
MLYPKKLKYSKYHRGTLKGKNYQENKLYFGKFGLLALEATWVTTNQLESVRKVISNSTQREAKLWFRIFPDKPITLRSSESRMGSGKGSLDHWVSPVKLGTIILEIDYVSKEIAKNSLKLAAHKLPMKLEFISKF